MSTALRSILRPSVRTLTRRCTKTQIREKGSFGRGHYYPYKSANEAIELLGKRDPSPPGTSTYGYRGFDGLVKSYEINTAPGLMMFVMWLWVLYNVIGDFEHLLGHYRAPSNKEMAAWTDEELGIPPDSED